MSIELFYPHPESQQRLRDGPLAYDIDAFAAWLAVEGYASPTAKKKLQFAADLSRWLESHQLAVKDLDCERVEAFQAAVDFHFIPAKIEGLSPNYIVGRIAGNQNIVNTVDQSGHA